MDKTRDELKQFHRIISALAASFSRTTDAALFKGYAWGLEDLPVEIIERACRRAVRDCHRMPTAAELRELAGVMTSDKRVVKAWAAVLRAITDVGSYQSVKFDDPPTIEAVHLLGGWPYLCRMDDEQLGYAGAAFRRAYATALTTGSAIEHLPGLHEMENRANGLTDFTSEPRLVHCGLDRRPLRQLASRESALAATPSEG